MPIWVTAVLIAGAISIPGQPQPDRQADFREAALEYGVPESVLLGVSYLQSRWDGNAGQPSVAGGFGPMHLVDAVAVPRGAHHLGDPRGDAERPMRVTEAPAVPPAAVERTLRQAARLTGVPPARLRRDPAANIRGGAALLAEYQRQAGGEASADPARWYSAVARYGGSSAGFAQQVFEVIRQGAERTTDDGSRVRLPPRADLPVPALRRAASRADCPESLACEWMPAAHKRFGKGDYGNHDRLNRPRRIDYIVIHDTEGSYGGIPSLVSNPEYVSWHYTIRSGDGHVAQHVRTGDIAWHAGNWDVNSRSIGIEHEGYLAKGGTWYTEAMYRSSAALVQHLATRFDVPLDRAHIVGHDNVPGTTASQVPGMHEDPGPYWDWARYFELMGAPITGADEGESVIIKPDYENNAQPFTGCRKSERACPAHGASTVWLHTAPRPDAPLVDDIGKRVGAPSTYSVYDHSARASTGQRYAVAGREGDWTAIWYLGHRAWFHNPPDAPTAITATGRLITPLHDKVPVYGRAYPEKSAYPRGVTFQPPSPLQYTLRTGQTYASGLTLNGTYHAAGSFRPSRHVTVRGRLRYHQIQLGHRMMFVRAKDVSVIN